MSGHQWHITESIQSSNHFVKIVSYPARARVGCKVCTCRVVTWGRGGRTLRHARPERSLEGSALRYALRSAEGNTAEQSCTRASLDIALPSSAL